MNKKQENRRWFDRWSRTYDRFLFRSWMWYWQDKTIDELPVRSKAILEIACGTGAGAEKAAKRFPDAQIFAMDLSPGMVREARKRLKPYKNVHVQVGDVEHIPYRKRFDCVFCTEAFHHFPDPSRAVSEMSRVAKRGGVIAVTDIYFLPLFIGNILLQLEPGFVRMYSRREFRSLFASSGILVVEQKRVGAFAIMTIGRRL